MHTLEMLSYFPSFFFLFFSHFNFIEKYFLPLLLPVSVEFYVHFFVVDWRACHQMTIYTLQLWKQKAQKKYRAKYSMALHSSFRFFTLQSNMVDCVNLKEQTTLVVNWRQIATEKKWIIIINSNTHRATTTNGKEKEQW